MTRVAIVAGSASRRRSLAELLAEDDRLDIVESPDLADVVVAIDGRTDEIPRTRAPVVLVTDGPFEERRFGREIRAWLPGHASASEIAAVIVAVSNDLVVMTRDQARRWLPAAVENDGDFVEALTRRELQVLRMLADGLGNKEIASQLGISDHTAKFHVAQILAKMGATSRAEAVVVGIRRGLVPI